MHMKTLLLSICLILTLLPRARSATFNIGWDDLNDISKGVIGYKVYSLTSTTNLLSTVSTNIASLTLPDAMHKITLTCFNPIGESVHSLPSYILVRGTNVVLITGLPGAPINIQLR